MRISLYSQSFLILFVSQISFCNFNIAIAQELTREFAKQKIVELNEKSVIKDEFTWLTFPGEYNTSDDPEIENVIRRINEMVTGPDDKFEEIQKIMTNFGIHPSYMLDVRTKLQNGVANGVAFRLTRPIRSYEIQFRPVYSDKFAKYCKTDLLPDVCEFVDRNWEFVEITGIEGPSYDKLVHYRVKAVPTEAGSIYGYQEKTEDRYVFFVKFDDGWRIKAR